MGDDVFDEDFTEQIVNVQWRPTGQLLVAFLQSNGSAGPVLVDAVWWLVNAEGAIVQEWVVRPTLNDDNSINFIRPFTFKSINIPSTGVTYEAFLDDVGFWHFLGFNSTTNVKLWDVPLTPLTDDGAFADISVSEAGDVAYLVFDTTVRLTDGSGGINGTLWRMKFSSAGQLLWNIPYLPSATQPDGASHLATVGGSDFGKVV